jgi:hypothetical protein
LCAAHTCGLGDGARTTRVCVIIVIACIVIVLFVAASITVLIIVAFARCWRGRVRVVFSTKTVFLAMIGLAFTLGDHGGWEGRAIVFVLVIVQRTISPL